jgi:hypothetical protein
MTAFQRCRLMPRLTPRVSLGAALAFSTFMPLTVLGSSAAWSHGAAQWIADGAYKAPSGSTCCGVSDCHRVAGAQAVRVTNGYKLAVEINGTPYDLFVPMKATFGSIDDAVWYCALPQDYLKGEARCLFLPGSV